ncbi:exosortase family protein XrtG [Clostridium acetobutylicum]|uniref:exosortase family protein XrtG n=1 Tax=Clostridium TaxID=1485 RepID=UPI000200C13B|nr:MULTISPECIES: exosortase family protein XrtG [Clostridium]ADZ21574.1 hypothetical protein CEA_G2537 [Clostridium acetobutylicum EA 2018]AEI32408.1 hypothetical protein SMB_G2559 [Clostridium acetobutylicum DSM 1731]AWV79107.1 exosortase family protein XrtG [Clostridium acetobutylicum]KHD38642.1 hypothetical protein NL50_03840 [Clostridium acetobutylicum]MBC2394932.1 exosortase family protein XrtG [Clostridium acetobutylicum]
MGNLDSLIIVTIIWISILVLFKNLKMDFFEFITGSLGIFTISMVFFMNPLEVSLNRCVSTVLYTIGHLTGYFQVFIENSIISLETKGGAISIFIDYECSGVIEMLVFTSLILFFPFGTRFRRVFYIIFGDIYIFLSNIIRVLFIIVITKTFGVSSYYIAHTLLSRILFFAFMIILYFYVFTSTQLKYQNVGEIR